MPYIHVPYSIACGDPDAEPGARMTCRLLLHLFRTPQVCLFPQGAGKLPAEWSFCFRAVASDVLCENIHGTIRNGSLLKVKNSSRVKS